MLLKDLLLKNNIDFKMDEPMSAHTTLRIGGSAKYFIMPSCTNELMIATELCKRANIRFSVIGRGSNLLVPDKGLDIAVISTVNMSYITFDDETVTAEAGVSLAVLSSEAAKKGLSGLEFAHGIPGTVGGAVFMNAGAYGGEIAQVLYESKYFLNGEVFKASAPEHDFGYRRSCYKDDPEKVILSASFRLTKGNSEQIFQKMRGFDNSRREKQPLEYPSAGSAYKRPEGYFAGKLIEDCGLKGYSVGGAQVSEKHAGFIINKGGATCADMLALMEHIEKTVYDKFGVKLEREIKIAEE